MEQEETHFKQHAPPAPEGWVPAEAGVCTISLSDRTVRFQNAACRKLCGDRDGRCCEQNCLRNCGESGESGLLGEGLSLRIAQTPAGDYFEVLTINDGVREIICFEPLAARLEKAQGVFRESGLTGQQEAVARAVVRGKSNRTVCAELGITENTLRSHLKGIYRKISPVGKALMDKMRQPQFFQAQAQAETKPIKPANEA
jgi:DNA-binding CsgD family transcriptional regulator